MICKEDPLIETASRRTAAYLISRFHLGLHEAVTNVTRTECNSYFISQVQNGESVHYAGKSASNKAFYPSLLPFIRVTIYAAPFLVVLYSLRL
jgi:hypothetical protein